MKNNLPGRAHRLDRLPPYPFAILGQRIQELIAAGKNVIRLDIGSPDLPPPEPVIDMLKRSASNPHNQSYGSYRGDPGFRRAVAEYYERRFGVTLDPVTEVMPLIGSKEGIVNLSLAYLDRGDAAILPDVAYPAYEGGVLLAGAEVIRLPVSASGNYYPDFDAISQDISRAKLLWINYPNNPTGAIADLAFYEKIIAFCQTHNLLLCSDNPYCDLTYDGYVAPSVLQVPGAKDWTVEFMSLSKTYNMAGWRLGACVGNRDAINTLLQIKSNMDSGHYKPIHDAGSLALTQTPDSWINARNARYQSRRDRILEVCPKIGLEASKMPASLYVWARVLDGDEQAYVTEALEQACVALAPGQIYGPGGQGYLRISLGTEESRLEEALSRLKAWYTIRVH